MIFQSTDMEYRVHLKQFDGPLDLLIHLIEKAEVDIKDIFVSEITSEFLSYMTELDELDMEQASEFLTVAATLVYAKSRSLFPPVLKETDGGGFCSTLGFSVAISKIVCRTNAMSLS